MLLSIVSSSVGAAQRVRCSLLKQLLILCCALSMTDANVSDDTLKAQKLSPTSTDLVAPVIPRIHITEDLPLYFKRHLRYISPHATTKLGLPPVQPPNYDVLAAAAHPPSSSGLSKPSMTKSGPPKADFSSPHLAEISPTQSSVGTLPTGLAQPPLSPHTSNCCGLNTVLIRGTKGCHCVYPLRLDLLLLNISSNPNLKLFLEEFAFQLGLNVSQIELINFYVVDPSRLNISMFITPLKGISFSDGEASRINSSLYMHRVHLDRALVGDYKVLNLSWFKPSAASQTPIVATSPAKTPPHRASPKPFVTSSTGKHQSLILILGIGAGILIIAIISLLIICSCTSHEEKIQASTLPAAKSRTMDTEPVAGSLSHLTSTRFLAYQELKEATNNFSPTSVLGEGGFGRVFKGVLNDGTAIAVKRLTRGGQQGDKEFLVEVEMLSRLHHRNIVKLIGYYSTRDSSQNLLCYELVPNGSLEAWLHGPLGVNCPLDWHTRMKIALDAARGLAYLHEDSQPCVIHRDFKASNILLENNFQAKVADFGLAKQAPEGRANYLSTRVMGTFGYVAPEYAMTGHLLVKSDVYSYGVVLLELLTGRKPVDMSQPSGQENLVTWARPILRDKDRFEELADPRLAGKYPNEDFVRVCTIAAACVAPEASQRPTIGEVVQSLKMVQRITEYQDPMSVNKTNNLRQSSTTFESDGTSSMFSSGPYSSLSAFDIDNISRTAVFSEDLHEGR